MSENGDKILEVVKLFIDNINETTKGVDRVEAVLKIMADDLTNVIRAIKVVVAVFGIAIFIGALIVFVGNRGWLSSQEKEVIIQPAPDTKEQLKELNDKVDDLIKRAKERANEDSKGMDG